MHISLEGFELGFKLVENFSFFYRNLNFLQKFIVIFHKFNQFFRAVFGKFDWGT